MNVLICHSKPEFRLLVSARLLKEFRRQGLKIDEVSNEAAAVDKIAKFPRARYDFLITNLELSPNPDFAIDQEHRGINIMRTLQNSGAKTECVVLVASDMQLEVGASFAGLSCMVVRESVQMVDDIVAILKSKRSKSSSSKRSKSSGRPRLLLKLVQDPNSSNWNFRLDGDASLGLHERTGAFAIQDALMEGLRERSEDILDGRDWLKKLGRIGQDLYAHFFDQGNNFSELFKEALGTAGGIESVRFCFNIRQDYYSLAIEAIVPPAKSPRSGQKHPIPPARLPFWMLRAPIYRTFSAQDESRTLGQERRPYLFRGEKEPVNCLIIQADAAGKAKFPRTKYRKPFNPLLCVREECEELEKILLKNQKRWEIGKVARISSAGSKKSFKKRLFELLRSRTWHLVHFCGHSYYRPHKKTRGNGYLIVPGHPAEAIDAREFAHYLGGNQFLFLSSCESSKEAFAFEMAANRVPAVLGFRGGVDDRDVPFFVSTFYKRLFAARSIESAFVATRRKIRNRRKGAENPLWASPMLVLMNPEEEKEGLPGAAGMTAAAAAG